MVSQTATRPVLTRDTQRMQLDSGRFDRIPLLVRLEPDTRKKILDMLGEIGTTETVPAGAVLMRRGDEGPSDGLLLITGDVTIDRGEGAPIHLAGPDFLGEMQQFDPQHRRGATITTETECHLVRFSWRDLVTHATHTLSQAELVSLRDALESVAADRLNDLAVYLRARLNPLAD